MTDIWYFDVKYVFEETVTYIGFNSYGTAAGFEAAWCTDLCRERSCKKECLATIIMTTTCPKIGEVILTSYFRRNVQLVDNDCCRYCDYSGSGVNAKLRGVQTEVDCWTCCNTDPACIVTDVWCFDIDVSLGKLLHT